MPPDTPPVVPARMLRRGRLYRIGAPERTADYSAAAAERGRGGERTGPWSVYVYPDWPGARGCGVLYEVADLEQRGFRTAP